MGKTIEALRLGELIESLCVEVSTVLPPDVLAALERAREREESPAGVKALEMLIENAAIAESLRVPICQDTGLFTIHLWLAEGTDILGDLTAEASDAVARATARAGLRPSIVEDPLGSRRNTGDNTPALVEVELSSGPESSLGVMAKGVGSEMSCRSAMLLPGAGAEGVVRFVEAVVDEVGARSCPPLVLGVGVGGSFDRAPALAKRALFRPLDEPAADEGSATLEQEILDAVNALGIGPAAMGGRATCIGVRVLQAPCHMGNLPVAVCVNCHALRRKVVTVSGVRRD